TKIVVAPMMPPVSELSLPIIAFCTTLEIISSTTKSNGVSCPNSRLPKMRNDGLKLNHIARPPASDLFGVALYGKLWARHVSRARGCQLGENAALDLSVHSRTILARRQLFHAYARIRYESQSPDVKKRQI